MTRVDRKIHPGLFLRMTILLYPENYRLDGNLFRTIAISIQQGKGKRPGKNLAVGDIHLGLTQKHFAK